MAEHPIRSISDLLIEHYEEVAFLWAQRRTGLSSPLYVLPQFLFLEERIEAHVQGLLLGSREATQQLLDEGLAAPDVDRAFAAAYALLRRGTPEATQCITEILGQASGPALDGIGEALSQSPVPSLLDQITAMALAADPHAAVVAAKVLAFQSPDHVPADLLGRLAKHDRVRIRQLAWRAMSRLQRAPALAQISVVYEAGEARADALAAAAWTRQRWLLGHCREIADRAEQEHAPDMRILGILGEPEDLPRVLRLCAADRLGPTRFGAVGTFGHSATLEALLEAIRSPDPRTAVAAGAAFTKITGASIDSQTRAILPPENGSPPDDFDREFLEEVILPNPEVAEGHWQKTKDVLSKGARWCHGHDLTHSASEATLDQLDMESRWEERLRARYRGTWDGLRTHLERFPLQPSPRQKPATMGSVSPTGGPRWPGIARPSSSGSTTPGRSSPGQR